MIKKILFNAPWGLIPLVITIAMIYQQKEFENYFQISFSEWKMVIPALLILVIATEAILASRPNDKSVIIDMVIGIVMVACMPILYYVCLTEDRLIACMRSYEFHLCMGAILVDTIMTVCVARMKASLASA